MRFTLLCRRGRWIAPLGLGLTLAWGCASTPLVVADASPSEVSHTGDPWPTVAPATLMPDRVVTGECEVVKDGESRIAGFTLTPEETDGPGRRAWTMEIEGRHTVRWELRDDGALCLPWQISHGEGVRVEYDPELVLLPPQGHGPTQTTATMRVFDVETGDERTGGQCTYNVSPAGPEAFEQVLDHKIDLYGRSHMKMDLTLAHAEVIAETAYARGQGPVAEDVTRTVRPLNLLGITTQTTVRRLMVHAEEPDPEGE